MVLRYKILTACLIIALAVVWLKDIEFFPLSSVGMYAYAVHGTTVDYYSVRDSSGAEINDDPQYYIMHTLSADLTALQDCFGGVPKACQDYFTMIARWRQQTLTLEHGLWNYKTDQLSTLQTLTIGP